LVEYEEYEDVIRSHLIHVFLINQEHLF